MANSDDSALSFETRRSQLINRKPRLRRGKSLTELESEKEQEAKERSRMPDKPFHKNRDSLLTTDSGYSDYRGLLNLGFILLILSNTRLALENILKYGILVDPIQLLSIFVHKPYEWPGALLLLFGNTFILTAFITEKALSHNYISETLGRILHNVNLIAIIIFPAGVILSLEPNPLTLQPVLLFHLITCLKLFSYSDVNKWCRDKRKSKHRSHFRRYSITDKDELTNVKFVGYPDNVNLKDLYYFMLVPTLCYELNLPRSQRIRKRFLLRRIAEILFFLGLIIGLVQQWIVPVLENSVQQFQAMRFTVMVERIMKLAIPNLVIWLMFFYMIFHSYFNAVGEILKFGDRQFYKAWWNSESIGAFWQQWNIPVHNWAYRHIYKRALSMGFTRIQSHLYVFFLSAVCHEYLVSIPLHMYNMWAFIGMMMQVPLAMLVDGYLHGSYGNMAMWLALIIGQPVAIMMYYHDFVVVHKVDFYHLYNTTGY